MSGGFTTRGGPLSVYADLASLEAAAGHLDELGRQARGCRAHVDERLQVHLAFLASRTPSAVPARTVALDVQAELAFVAGDLEQTAAHVRAAAEGYRRGELGARAAVEASGQGLAAVGADFRGRTRHGAHAEDLEFLISRGGAELTHAAVSTVVTFGVDAAVTRGLGRMAGGVRAPEAALDGASLGWRRLGRGGDEDGEVLGRALELGRLSEVVDTPWTDPAQAAGDAVADWVMGAQALSGLTTANGQIGLIASGIGERAVEPGLPLTVPAPAPRLEGSVAELAALQPGEGAPSHAVSVTAVRAEDGQDTYIVSLPGTRGSAAHGILGDWDGIGGIADALGRGSDQTAQGVAAALAVAGVPAGARVVLTGHSQGGVHAVNLSRHEAITKDYRVGGVVTFGAPSGGSTAGPGVPTLNLVDAADGVTGLDGGPDPVSVSQATVTFHTPPAMLPEQALRELDELVDRHGDPVGWAASEQARTDMLALLDRHGQSLFASHDMAGYLEHARTLDGAGAEELREIGPLLAGLGALTAGRVGSRVYVPLTVSERRGREPGGRRDRPGR